MLSTIGKVFNGQTGLEENKSDDAPSNMGGATNEASEKLIQEFFGAIQEGDTDTVRQLLMDHKTNLTRARFKPEPRSVGFPAEIERDAYTLLGAYLGPLTGLQYAILTGRDGIAKDILDSTFEQDVDARFGNGNTALHLAVLLGAPTLVSALIERSADITLKNKRGYSVVDMSDNPDILCLLKAGTVEQEE
ncbi:hypothetical protein BX616_006996 [Lobosporangium transversale]|uniref:Uncharacterized protein n=1 Tax=Lobosporangium transversale TaxID=64571 RepID=A0A1Y2GK61_9FUNG|nr:hypothetical protein BCR41DRAFT_355615 [Lobosporangium transversale]KAF9915050.1 hypothetical protein BX616_006996 [Lobosporangium transversale]ORZ13398.1 hypothetical protein BCR41DRAFT_355615 [Lobosporangium transversale]|eukprot:XP_021880479.1 hypothetical protein BCR41DRAFT_355615 [Lobosporangium transversale]